MTWGGLDEIFNPGAAHFREEMDRKRVEARVPGNEGGPNSVDLDKGIVRITVTRKTDEPVEAPEDGPQDALSETPQDALSETPQDAPSETPQDAPQDSVGWPVSPQDEV